MKKPVQDRIAQQFTSRIKHPLCLMGGVLGLMFLNTAHAQSSVTLYGLISTGVAYANDVETNSATHKGSSLVQLANGGMQAPRWGIKGVEDLGGGTTAIFTLENGFSITNGSLSGSKMFARQAFVGLSNKQYGTVTLGRQYDELPQLLWWGESGNVFAGNGTHIGDSDNMYNTYRYNNDVRYQSPTIYGFTIAGDYAFSNSTGFSNNNAYSLGSTYIAGKLKLGVAFSANNRRSNAADNNTASGAVDTTSYYTSPFQYAKNSTTIGTDSQRIFGASANYDFGIVNATVSYTNVLFNYSNYSGLRLQNVEGFVYKRFTPAWMAGVAYIYTFGRYSDGTEPRYHQVNLGTIYSLSKRTDLFLWGVYQRAAGSAQHAQIYGIGESATKSQLEFEAGIRHRF